MSKRILNRVYGDLPLRDATRGAITLVQKQDEQGATRGDPRNCPIARSLKRQLGASAVLIWRTVAYVDIKGEDGIRRVERFQLSQSAKELVQAFDQGERIPADGRAFALLAPSKSEQLDGKVRRRRRRRQRSTSRPPVQKGKISESGTTAEPKGKAAKNQSSKSPSSVRGYPVRNGSGQIQMTRA